MMARTLDDALGCAWVDERHSLVPRGPRRPRRDGRSTRASGLPGWTRRHVAAHLAANADAVGNLVHWAATGERTPMYSSPEQRAADIERGSTPHGDELRAWFDASAARLCRGDGRAHRRRSGRPRSSPPRAAPCPPRRRRGCGRGR